MQYQEKKSARLGPGQGRTFGLVQEVLSILGQARAELLVYCKKFWPSWARPGRNFWYMVKSFAHLRPSKDRNCCVWHEVLSILGEARAELLAHRQKFCPSWAQQEQNFWRIAESSVHLGPGQGRTFCSLRKVLPILCRAMAELLV